MALNVEQGAETLCIAGGKKRSGPPEEFSSNRAGQRFTPPIFPDSKRRNMKCIAAVLVVLGMFDTTGATPHAPRTRALIYEQHRVSW